MKKEEGRLEPLFKSTDEWQTNATVNRSSDLLDTYTFAYKKAADILVQMAIEDRCMQDFLVYPICFLYRHFIKLELKWIINSGRSLLDEGNGFPQHHRIDSLWNEVKIIIQKVFPDEESLIDISLAEHVISEFAKYDSDSFAFRYPCNKDGENPLKGVSNINIRHLTEYLQRFTKFIVSISEGIAIYLDYKSDMQSDFRDY